MKYDEMPLSALLKNREVFSIFEKAFRSGSTWMDVTALLTSESSLKDLAADGIVPQDTIDRIRGDIEALIAQA